MFMVFQTQQDALTAEAAISKAMGLPRNDPNGYVAERWAVPVELIDGRWTFLKPASLPALSVPFVETNNPEFSQPGI